MNRVRLGHSRMNICECLRFGKQCPRKEPRDKESSCKAKNYPLLACHDN